MIKVYTGSKGFAVFLLYIAGALALFTVFLWGAAKAIELLLPLLIAVSYLMIVLFLFGLLPAAFSVHLRPSLGAYALLMSRILGIAAWMMSFFFVIKIFGVAGILLALLFQFLVPVAIAGALF